jgi:PKD repeat protein
MLPLFLLVGAGSLGAAVGGLPVALFSVTGAGLVRTLDSTDSRADEGISSRAWDFGDGDTAGDIVAPVHAFPATGTYTVTLTITDNIGQTSVFTTEVTVGLPTTITNTVTVVERIDTSATSQASIVSICNLALGHLGISKTILALTEASEQAKACNRFFPTVRDEVLRAFAWPFATQTELLALVATSPTIEWAYAYRYPIDALAMHRLLSGVGRQETRASRVPYRIQRDVDGQLLLTDLADAQLEYTVRVVNAGEYPPDFSMALSLRLAGMIAPQLTSGDPGKLGLRALQFYDRAISEARVASANEEQPDVEPESESISARY